MAERLIIPNYKRLRRDVSIMDQGINTLVGGEVQKKENGTLTITGGLLDSESFPLFLAQKNFTKSTKNTPPGVPTNYEILAGITNCSVIITTVFEESPVPRLSQNILITPIPRETRRIDKSVTFGRNTDTKP